MPPHNHSKLSHDYYYFLSDFSASIRLYHPSNTVLISTSQTPLSLPPQRIDCTYKAICVHLLLQTLENLVWACVTWGNYTFFHMSNKSWHQS